MVHAARREALYQLLGLAPGKNCGERYHLAPFFPLEVGIQQVGQLRRLTPSGILFFYIASGGEIFLKGEMSKLVYEL